MVRAVPAGKRMSDEAPTQFTMGSARRIAQAVRTVESLAFGRTDIRRRRAFNEDGGDPFMFQVVSAPTPGAFTVRPGIWERFKNVCPSSHKADFEFDPVAGSGAYFPALFAATYTGVLHVYTLLLNSDGSGYTPSNPLDFSNDSVIYDCGNAGASTGQMIVASVNAIIGPTPAGDAGQFKHIATLTYEDGGITNIAQTHMGAISDTPATMFNPACQFGVRIQYDDTTKDYTIQVLGGLWRVRSKEVTVVDGGLETSDQTYFYASTTEDATAEYTDTSLMPTTATIVADIAALDVTGYTYYCKLLFTQEAVTVDAASGITAVDIKIPNFTAIHHPGGEIQHDWVRPDGKDVGGLFATNIDGGYPRLLSLSFNTYSGPHTGELQDHNAYETILGSGEYISGDKVVSYFSVDTAGTTSKAYAYIDTHGASLLGRTAPDKSLEVVSASPSYMQVFGFSTPDSHFLNITDTSLFSKTVAAGYLSLLGRSSADPANIIYVSLADFTPAGVADHSIKDDHTDSPGGSPSDGDVLQWDTGTAMFVWTAVGDLIAGALHTELDFTVAVDAIGVGVSGGNTDHDDSYWHAYNDGSGLMYHDAFVDTGSYHTTGEVRANDFYVQDSTGNHWDAGTLAADVTGNIIFTADGKLDMTVGAASAWGITGDLGITITTGALNLTLGANSTWQSKKDLYIDSDADNTNYFRLGEIKYFNEVGLRGKYVYLEGDDNGILSLGGGAGRGFTTLNINGTAAIADGTQAVVEGITVDGAGHVTVIATKTITFKKGIITSIS